MIRRHALLLATLTMIAAVSCSKQEEGKPAAGAPPAPAASTVSGDDKLAKIPILPGYKYYAGGPVMRQDPYGRFRIASFNGEVPQPPSRGMIFGAKVEGDKMEYRVWGNGVLLSMFRGQMRDGLFWKEYAETYRRGKIVARETTTNDDTAKRSKSVTEDIDPENGEVIRTKESSISYLPVAMPADMKDDDEEDEAPAAAPAAPAASAPAPGAAK